MTGEGLFVFWLKTKSVMPFFAIFPAETSSSYYEYLKMFTEGNSRNCKKKEEKYKKTPIFLTHCCHGNDLHKVNNNTNVIARMLLILLENFMNISHRGEKRGFLKHF